MSHHCRRFMDRPVSRREMLTRCAGGFGGIALASLLADDGRAADPGEVRPGGEATETPGPDRGPHFEPQVKNVIFL